MEKNHSYIVRKIVNFVALATILLSLIVWGLTEGLSVFCLLNPKAIRMAWAALAVLFLGISIFLIKKKSVVNDLKYSLVFLRTDLSRIEMGMLLLGLCMTCGTFFIAYVTVPFNWDSMTYHLAFCIQLPTLAK